MKNNLSLFLKKCLAAFLIGGILYTPGWGFPFFLNKQERLKKQFFEELFSQTPTQTRLQIKKELTKLVEKELLSIRFAPPSLVQDSAVQSLLDQINGFIKPTHSQEELNRFKQHYLRRLRRPLQFYQLKLDNNPGLKAYTFRPSREALYSRHYFKSAPHGVPVTIQEILGSLFEQRTVKGALKFWHFEPALIQLSPRRATLWFPPAAAQGPWLQIKVNFQSRFIFADLQPAP